MLDLAIPSFFVLNGRSSRCNTPICNQTRHLDLNRAASGATTNGSPSVKEIPIRRIQSAVSSMSCDSNAMALRSSSVNSINSEFEANSVSSEIVDQEGIAKLTKEVRNFKEILGKLKKIFSADKEKVQRSRVVAHESLGAVLRVLQEILLKHPKLKSNELFLAANSVIRQVRDFRYEDECSTTAELLESVDQLALAFSSCVSAFLMGDLDSSNQTASKTRSCDNLLTAENDVNDSCHLPSSARLSPEEIDSLMKKLPQGVEVALHHAKMWSKYAKELATYIDKHSSLEVEYARSLIKLAHTVQPTLRENEFMSFKSVYNDALDHNIEHANTVIATFNLLQGQECFEPLMTRRGEHERQRKRLKEIWHRQLKTMQEAVSNWRKSKSMYFQKQQEYEKAKESLFKAESVSQSVDVIDSSKIEKKRKLKEDNLQKALDAEATYKACITEAEEKYQGLERVKGEVLRHVQELIHKSDQTMKSVTINYFQLQHKLSRLSPPQLQSLCDKSIGYEPGLQYMEWVKRQSCTGLQHSLSSSAIQQADPNMSSYIFDSYNLENELHVAKSRSSAAIKMSWSGNIHVSDSDSIGSASNRSREPSPSASPHISSHEHKMPFAMAISSGDELENDYEPVQVNIHHKQNMSKAAITHVFKKLKTPSRCRECDSYVYFHGAECTKCGLSCHKKCLELLAIQCGKKRLPRKMTTFGIELGTHLLKTKTLVPPIVSKCIYEIESRGIRMKGIYRISGVKSKVEKLCQTFESGMELVDASEVRPCVIANALKLYLRQLPEPLLISKLYKEFINASKMLPDVDRAVDELKMLVQHLPKPYYATLTCLMHHLKRVADLSEENNMPSTNLGIVFGPTLLRSSQGNATLSSLIDTVDQTKVVKLLIDHVDDIFGPDGQSESHSKKVPTETDGKSSVSNEKKDESESIDEMADKKSNTCEDLNSSSDDLRDDSADFDDLLDMKIAEDSSFDSETLNHPAFSRRSAARIEHRRYRNLSKGFNLSQISKDVQRKTGIDHTKMQPFNDGELSPKDEVAETEVEGADQTVDGECDDFFNEHPKLEKIANFPSSSITAHNAQLRSKFFANQSSDEMASPVLSKSLSASSVSSCSFLDNGSPMLSSSSLSNRLSKGPIYLPKTCLIPSEEILIPDRPSDASPVEKNSENASEIDEKVFSSRYSYASSERTRSSSSGVYSLMSKSPNCFAFPQSNVDRNFSSSSTSEALTSHRALTRSYVRSFQCPDSSSESLSSEHSRYSAKSKYHSPLAKTKSSGSSEGYNEDEELMMENNAFSSPKPETNGDSPLTFV